MMPSFMAKKVSSSSGGRPRSFRKTCEGNGTENSLAKSTSPRSMNWSMRSLTSAETDSSMAVILRGEKIGSSSLRYLRWSGGSIWSGIIGRLFFRSTASMLDEKISGWRRASSISALRERRMPLPEGRSIDMTGSSRISLKTGCGLRAISGSMPESGFSPPPSASVVASISVSIGFLRLNLKNAVHGLHERCVIGLGNDPAAGEQANDHVGQLSTVEFAPGHGGDRVERVAQTIHQLGVQGGQVVEEEAHAEAR